MDDLINELVRNVDHTAEGSRSYRQASESVSLALIRSSTCECRVCGPTP